MYPDPLYSNVHLSPCPVPHPARSDRARNAGELLGGLVEKVIRLLLSGYLPLQEERMLTWQQPLTHGPSVWLQRELDAVAGLDHRTLLVCEIKLTTPRQMARGIGQQQLQTAAQILQAAKPDRRILRRLVYVGEEGSCTPSGWPSLSLQDVTRKAGVLWIAASTIERVAMSLGGRLPSSWQDPAFRSRLLLPAEWSAWPNTLLPTR